MMWQSNHKNNNHLNHLQDIFEKLLRHNMWLNPLKCLFELVSGKFLGYLITRRGIEANPE